MLGGMSAKTKYLFAPIIFVLFAAIPGVTALHSLHTGVIWRGGGHEPVITLAKDAQAFYESIIFLSGLALIFLATAVWSVVLIIRHKNG